MMNSTDFSVKNRVAFVTGGGTGIGRQFAKTLASAGSKVVVLGRRESLLQETVNEIESSAGEASYLACDLTKFSKLDTNIERCKSFYGSADILANVAGLNLRQPVEAVDETSWDATLDINLKLPFFLAKLLVPDMKAKGFGKIINIASLQCERAFPNSMPYGASKGGVCQLTRAMAEAWSCYGITCNAIAPGFFPTELTLPVYEDNEALNKLANQTAIGRNGSLDDLDGPLLFLSSPASDYVTGQTLFVDGGFTAK
ncbi:putative 2-deoxy-D-gluconate 3-dehydrogenase [Vibrio nigripulchritudo SFn27]|uniref:Putative 2-deoxy-D-gluconate 3-dehydrogenase n=1 Tax=Vibrio nigripulchritudo TaxID=28173 RepID=U4KFP9_9VIBR|nr:SDR family oxidoreductase [Vibrio nigripulchritudo]CCN83429.1 putative 2-deoxy-D-gluconate 3-dehydrogenase [Vibrio nigripulchritudo BLFn1]CCN88788.1 putative 2-deoxy-D-gluconate 3-dehydrogenase [Vibrio nigripulchritudo SFn27]CCN94983.1 putative 2-deoxy-D-gluconate 3-dehydrogenase [Vibrio nigripulchritudo ENn2]CCO41133.1 putative 2-deoxy-D-gluconate 3-dehydrogenase [Vibrio nigripulchritudo SFn135]CCO52450.1 putative 2-deoxy-D-gluconate 3-dehydrogenase [Vibrio nigripulchritudo Wn13]